MFPSSRKLLFLSATAVIVCILGAFGYAQSVQQKAQSPVTAADFDQFSWRWVGPMTFAGRVSGYAVPSGQSQTYYVLMATGGVWKTVDGGTHFEPIFEHYGTQSMGWLAVAPSNPNILYLGTGEPMHARASTHGKGMWKSTDAGKTWTHIGLDRSYFIPMVAVDSKNPDIVYAAAEGKLYDNEMDCERGLFKSIDGGKTWTNLGPMKDRGVGDFVIDPRNSNIIIASAYKLYRRAWTYDDRDRENGLFKSTDGGKTWNRLAAGLPPLGTPIGRTGLAIYAKNPNIVYARVDQTSVVGFQESDGIVNFRPAPAGGRGGGRGGVGGGTALLRDGVDVDRFKAYTIPAELSALAPKFTPVIGATEAELVTKFNELLADNLFLVKTGADVARLQAAARKLFASNDALMVNITAVEKLMAKPAAAADSTEGRARSQIVNRNVLEILYSGILANAAPVTMNGVVYRSDNQGNTWQAMTEYLLPPAAAAGGARGQGGPAGAPAGGRGGPQLGSAQVNQTEGGYYGRIIIDPNDDKVLYCGDTNTTKSTDSGKTFTATGWERGNSSTHVDHRVVWVDPLNSKHILSGNDGGSSESWDGGEHWRQSSTINAQQFYDVFVDNQQPYNIMGGTQDNGAWIGPSQTRNGYGMFAADWRYLPTGDAFYVVRDWWNPDFIYYESQFGASSRMILSDRPDPVAGAAAGRR